MGGGLCSIICPSLWWRGSMGTIAKPRQLVDSFQNRFGIKAGDVGAHTSRTLMLAELRELLGSLPASAKAADYRIAIVNENLLSKRTQATRKLSYQRLSELYALDPAVPIFRTLRRLWETDRAGRPMLALLVAYARDPLLRATAMPVLRASQGKSVTASVLDEHLSTRLGSRLSQAVRGKVSRNAASTWTQSGHLTGRVKKMRTAPVLTPPVVAFAFLLANASGSPGRSAFTSEYVALLDRPPTALATLLHEAHRAGLMTFRQAGDVVDLGFSTLLTPAEETAIHGV